MTDPGRNSAKYRSFRKRDRSGRGQAGAVGGKAEGQYAAGVGPRVGGTVKPSTPLRSASRNQMRSARRTVRRIGTGKGVTKPRY